MAWHKRIYLGPWKHCDLFSSVWNSMLMLEHFPTPLTINRWALPSVIYRPVSRSIRRCHQQVLRVRWSWNIAANRVPLSTITAWKCCDPPSWGIISIIDGCRDIWSHNWSSERTVRCFFSLSLRLLLLVLSFLSFAFFLLMAEVENVQCSMSVQKSPTKHCKWSMFLCRFCGHSLFEQIFLLRYCFLCHHSIMIKKSNWHFCLRLIIFIDVVRCYLFPWKFSCSFSSFFKTSAI